MQGIRNLIHRRRPSAVLDLGPTEAETAPEITEPLEIPDHTARTLDARQIELARSARDRVPRAEQVRPRPAKPTMGQRDAKPDDDPTPSPAPSRPQIWDIEPPEPQEQRVTEAADAAETNHNAILAKCAADPLSPALRDTPAAPAPNRAKTRLLGFHDDGAQPDAFAARPAAASGAAPRFPIGWIVVLDGPGRGASFTLTAGLSTIGRNAGQTIVLDFGDTAISRENHVSIAFDEEDNQAFIGHGGKSNIVRLNDKPLLTTETLNDGDTIRLGKTVLRFVGLCAGDFSWVEADTDD